MHKNCSRRRINVNPLRSQLLGYEMLTSSFVLDPLYLRSKDGKQAEPNVTETSAGSVSRFGSGVFLLIQVVILLDFTHNWNAAWVAKDEQFW